MLAELDKESKNQRNIERKQRKTDYILLPDEVKKYDKTTKHMTHMPD